MKELIQFVIALLIVGALFTVIEKVFAAKKGKLFFRKGWKLDFLYLLFMPGLGKFIERSSLFVVLVPLYFLIIGGLPDHEAFMRGFGLIGAQPFWLQAVQLLVISDFISYWLHRGLFHDTGRLWKIHTIHHSSEELDWLSSVRAHPLNEAIMSVIRTTPLVLLGWSPASVALLLPILTLHGILLHANVKWTFGIFRYVVSSPVFHRWHHTKVNEGGMKNFSGLFPIWDILFGTFYMPKGKYPEHFGVDETVPETFKEQMLYPFRRRAKKSEIRKQDAKNPAA